MSSSNRVSSVSASSDEHEHDLAQTLQQIAKGEKTAQALESNLTNLEKKIDDLLASFEESERAKVEEANAKLENGGGSTSGASGGKEEKA
ncbi:hypothetical protein VTL71DRAFT_4163 [Oculimacula yallundae]|uniref:Uncharacterized protein n=1 Tax=Oculimacula yallundae TaxID=86028 RepID=A0ABR4C521_9HELO